jgi:hypothetical protein
LRERGNTHGGVGIAGSIFRKRAGTRGRVRVAVDVVKERSVADGGVEAAKENSSRGVGVPYGGTIVKQGECAISRIGGSACVI